MEEKNSCNKKAIKSQSPVKFWALKYWTLKFTRNKLCCVKLDKGGGKLKIFGGWTAWRHPPSRPNSFVTERKVLEQFASTHHLTDLTAMHWQVLHTCLMTDVYPYYNCRWLGLW